MATKFVVFSVRGATLTNESFLFPPLPNSLKFKKKMTPENDYQKLKL